MPPSTHSGPEAARPPDVPVRGFMLDVSRNKVPTPATLTQWIDLLAECGINHLQLYTEHTFAYRGHESVWHDASPLTPEEIRELDSYCAERSIELTPNQNSLGHLHRWLKLPAYRHLAEAPEGYTTPWGEFRDRPFSLNPVDPRCLDLLADWYAQLLPNFRSRRFNVGCDEAFDLGQGRSREACGQRGKGRVYLDYLCRVHDLVRSHGRSMLFWGDIILNHPDLIPEIPRDCTALVWGYEADHPFDRECAAFAEAGIDFWVCPGTSTWNSLAGRWTNARANLRAAARAGLAHRASGVLLTEWGDNGHWQTFPFSAAALRMGAAYARDPDAADRMPDRDFFPGPTGDIQLDLAEMWRRVSLRKPNLSPLFSLVVREDPASLIAEIDPAELAAVLDRLDDLAGKLDALRSNIPALEYDETRLILDLMRIGCCRGLGRRDRLQPLLEETVPRFRACWLARNRPGGLDESIAPLERRAAEASEA